MKYFICGDARFKFIELKNKTILLPNKQKITNLPKKFTDNYKTEETYVDLNKKIEKIFRATKTWHGFSGILHNEKIYFAFHTSKKHTNVFGMEIDNIPIQEDYNPIKNVNSTVVMDIKDFTKYFEITHPYQMLSSERYEVENDYDMAYLALRAIHQSLIHSLSLTTIKEINEEILKIIQKKDIQVTEDNLGILPAQIEISEGNDENVIKKVDIDLKRLDSGEIGKKSLIYYADENFTKVINTI